MNKYIWGKKMKRKQKGILIRFDHFYEDVRGVCRPVCEVLCFPAAAG